MCEGSLARDPGARGGAENAEAMMAAAKALDEIAGEIVDAAYNPHTEPSGSAIGVRSFSLALFALEGARRKAPVLKRKT